MSISRRPVHTGYEGCPVRPLHDPCHTGCSEDGRTLDDMTATSLWLAWRHQIRGTPAVPEILEIIELVDAHLDSAASPDYQAQPLARDWARITKVCEEAGEVWKAQSRRTGENPRKGVSGTTEELLDELGDTASAALCAIQHITKNTDLTWTVFLGALAKARSRVPSVSPFPPEPGMVVTDGNFGEERSG